MDRLEHRCILPEGTTLAKLLEPAFRAVTLAAEPVLVVELHTVEGRAVLRHTLAQGLRRRRWDSPVVAASPQELRAEGAEGLEGLDGFRHSLRLEGGSLASVLEWEACAFAPALGTCRLDVPVPAGPAAADRPTTRIVLSSKVQAA